MAAWHSERPDAVQIAPLLPGPAGALPHYGAHRNRSRGAKNPPDCKNWVRLEHCYKQFEPHGADGIQFLDLRNHLKTNRCLILFFRRVQG